MRILFVNRMASMERGGGETFDLEIARHLAQMGHEVTFLSGIPLSGRARLPIEEECGGMGVWGYGGREDSTTPKLPYSRTPIRSITLRAPMFPWFPWDKVKGGWRVRVAEFWLFEKRAARWAWKHRNAFDIIQVCELPAFVSALRSKRVSQPPRIVMRLTAPNVFDPSGGIQKADAVIASGTSIEKIRQSVRPDCHDVPNAVDVDRFHPGMNHEPSTILLYVARFQDFKNHRVLIEAFARVLREQSNTRLVLVGGGPLMNRVQKQCRDLGVEDHVEFRGEVPFDELPGVYANADLKVISSDYESFCFAAIEAMSTGLAVVSTDCGWVPGLLGDALPPIRKQWVDADGEEPGRFVSDRPGEQMREVPGGLIVGRNDPESMAKAILLLLRDEAKRRRCGDWNREKAVREHGWEASALKLADLYQALLTKGSSR